MPISLHISEMSYAERLFRTAEEIRAVIEEIDDEEVDAVILPPDVDELTDEENIDDGEMIINDGGQSLPTDATGTFEIHTASDANEKIVAQCARNNSAKCSKKRKRSESCWVKNTPVYNRTPVSSEGKKVEQLKNKYGSFTPTQMFDLFFDNSFLSKIVEFSIKYAQSKNNHNFALTVSDLRKFMGILLLSGYHTLPQTKHYWSKDADKGVPIVRESMSRNRFEEIKKYLHVSDNSNLDKNDKFAKLRPYFEELNRKFLQFGVFSQKLSVDEQMVPYFGRHSAKMFIRGKPVRFGFKLWCISSSTGYVYQFDAYGGASQKMNDNLSLGERVVLNLAKIVENPRDHLLFFDNFFTSHSLLVMLSERGFFATGTLRENRTANCPLQTSKQMAKGKKGACDYRFDSKHEIFVVRWHDNSIVTVATNTGTLEPFVNTKRYNRKERKHEIVLQPNTIHQYNQGMGGVDLHDNAIANYRIRIRGKKWWWPLFTNGLDSAMVNAWKVQRLATGDQMNQIDFKSEVVMSLLRREEADVLQKSSDRCNLGHLSSKSLPVAVVKDRVDHIVIRDERDARRRCRVCGSQTIFKCKKCQIHLHTNCFSTFHA